MFHTPNLFFSLKDWCKELAQTTGQKVVQFLPISFKTMETVRGLFVW